MTIAVGILCSDGVVIATDSCAMSGTKVNNQPVQIIETSANKIITIHDDVLVSVSGNIGIADRIYNVFKANFKEIVKDSNSQTEIGVKVYGSVLFEIGRTNIQFGQGFGCLLAYYEKEEFYLCEFPAQDFQPEYKSKSICFGSLGVTAFLTEPLLAYASRILWKNELPTVEQATLIGAWSVKFAIDFNVSGIRGPIQIAKLCKNKTTNKIETHHFDQAGIATIMDRVKSFEDHIQSFFQ